MPEIINEPVLIPVPGGKRIAEHVGRVVNGETAVSIAHMHAPAGWDEPAQTPEFDEYTLVLKGLLQVEVEGESVQVRAGQTIITRAGEQIRYSVIEDTEYVAVCLPAFAPELAHRAD